MVLERVQNGTKVAFFFLKSKVNCAVWEKTVINRYRTAVNLKAVVACSDY